MRRHTAVAPSVEEGRAPCMYRRAPSQCKPSPGQANGFFALTLYTPTVHKTLLYEHRMLPGQVRKSLLTLTLYTAPGKNINFYLLYCYILPRAGI